MGFLRKSRGQDAGPTDDALTFFTRDQANDFRALVGADTVAVYNSDHTSRLGGWEKLHDHGMRNLGGLPVEHHEQLDGPDGSAFHVLLGDSVHTASRALLLPSLAYAVAGEEDAGHGWLMSIPNRHQVTWHMIRDASVIPVVSAMAHFAALGHADAPSPLSPHVYWWDGSGYQQLTHIGEDGNRSVQAGPEFTEMLNQVVGE